MTVTEKLKQQMVWGAELMYFDSETQEETDILPQIVAVVEAAERGVALYPSQMVVAGSLAALDKVMT